MVLFFISQHFFNLLQFGFNFLLSDFDIFEFQFQGFLKELTEVSYPILKIFFTTFLQLFLFLKKLGILNSNSYEHNLIHISRM